MKKIYLFLIITFLINNIVLADNYIRLGCQMEKMIFIPANNEYERIEEDDRAFIFFYLDNVNKKLFISHDKKPTQTIIFDENTIETINKDEIILIDRISGKIQLGMPGELYNTIWEGVCSIQNKQKF